MTDTTPADLLRAVVAQALATDDGHPWGTLSMDAQQHYCGNADAVLAVLPAPALAVARQLLGTTSEDGRRCVCGDPIEWMTHPDGSGWIHSPGTDTRCLDARPAAAPPAPADRAAVPATVYAAIRRLAAHAVGFQDVLDEGDQGAWGKTIGADIAELRRLAGEAAAGAQQPGGTEGAAEHEHTWVTALDGDDRPARDETGRAWTHCGICGRKPREPHPTTADLAAALDVLREHQTPAAPVVPEERPCPAGLLPLDDSPVNRCVEQGPHTEHATATGQRWTTEEPTP